MTAPKSDLTYAQLRLAALSLYEQGHFRESLALIDQHQERFPEQLLNLTYWRICLLARLDEQTAALSTLREALSRGFWWSEKMMLEDPDLASLLPLPDFQKLMLVCRERQEEAQKTARPRRFILVPEQLSTTAPLPLLLCLHGRASSTTTSVEYWQHATRSGWLVAMLGSSQVIGYETYCWDDPQQAEAEITQQYAEICELMPVDASRVVLAGFSQGGGLAARAAANQHIPAAGFLAVAPALLDFEVFEKDLADRKTLRGLIMAGELDVRWAAAAQRIHQSMQTAGLASELYLYPDLGHDFPPDFHEKLSRFLNSF